MGKSKRTRVRKSPYEDSNGMDVETTKGPNRHFSVHDITDPETNQIDVTKLFVNMCDIREDNYANATSLSSLMKLHRIENKAFLKRKNDLKEIMNKKLDKTKVKENDLIRLIKKEIQKKEDEMKLTQQTQIDAIKSNDGSGILIEHSEDDMKIDETVLSPEQLEFKYKKHPKSIYLDFDFKI